MKKEKKEPTPGSLEWLKKQHNYFCIFTYVMWAFTKGPNFGKEERTIITILYGVDDRASGRQTLCKVTFEFVFHPRYEPQMHMKVELMTTKGSFKRMAKRLDAFTTPGDKAPRANQQRLEFLNKTWLEERFRGELEDKRLAQRFMAWGLGRLEADENCLPKAAFTKIIEGLKEVIFC